MYSLEERLSASAVFCGRRNQRHDLCQQSSAVGGRDGDAFLPDGYGNGNGRRKAEKAGRNRRRKARAAGSSAGCSRVVPRLYHRKLFANCSQNAVHRKLNQQIQPGKQKSPHQTRYGENLELLARFELATVSHGPGPMGTLRPRD